MIPRLAPSEHLPELYREFLQQLRDSAFSGQIRTDYATRLITATDNSVYQIIPLAVLYPKVESDVRLLLSLSAQNRFRAIKISPRGGGTGTNGQSLCDGLIVDLSRHFRDILELNLEQGWVRVQPGVVLDQLNKFLAPSGVFFAPNLSPSSRATIGGMISTDASGKGSRIYGKTSEHVLGLRCALGDGSIITTKPLNEQELGRVCQQSDREGEVYRQVRDIVGKSRGHIERELPQLKRFLTGYDLAHVETTAGFDLGRVICGSEGTLCLLTEAKLRLTKLARFKRLVAVRYPRFDDALRAASRLVALNPGAIETIDDTIVSLARKDTIWHAVGQLIDAEREPPARAINLIEFESHDEQQVTDRVSQLCSLLDAEQGSPGKCSGYTVASDAADISALWSLRKKGVGLLGNAPGERRPVPFVEDTAVPPEKLADYIADFRALLDARGLRYGMFGHVDVGCLHVRPALDLKDPEDEKILADLSDEVVALVKKYGGVLWGEHGKGYRSQYTPSFFGGHLYEQLRGVKRAFDPHNQLNPGKLATPAGSSDQLVSIHAPKRGSFDRQIKAELRGNYQSAVVCNGNGACFDWDPDSVMCPSSKVTGERIHSPKGRAGILREWLRLLSENGHGHEAGSGLGLLARSEKDADFSHQVYDAMSGCLACKACATQCPIKVDIPAMRSEFLQTYHGRYRRPLKDYFVATLEPALALMSRLPKLFNWLASRGFVRRALKAFVGIVDAPLLADQSLGAGLRARSAPRFDESRLRKMSEAERSKLVFLVQDAFTSFLEPEVALAAYDLLTRLGRTVVVLPFRSNGKGLHIKGFLGAFRRAAARNVRLLQTAADFGVPLVGLEPAVTLTYRDEYPHELPEACAGLRVELLQEYLCAHSAELSESCAPTLGESRASFELFGHCTERTFAPQSGQAWQRVFQAAGLSLELADVGCCGMCGVFGHEAEHLAESKGVYAMSWGKALSQQAAANGLMLATGHSCRSQVKRFSDFTPRHPVQVLNELAGSAREGS